MSLFLQKKSILLILIYTGNVTLIKSLFGSGVMVNPEKQLELLEYAINGNSALL